MRLNVTKEVARLQKMTCADFEINSQKSLANRPTPRIASG
jgi:hypothetical protein